MGAYYQGIIATENEELRQLALQYVEKNGNPQDFYEITAGLESMGWNDRMARETFGHPDIFALAQEIWSLVMASRLHAEPFVNTEKMPIKDFLLDSLRSFLRGLIFSLPMAISVISMLTLRFSLWSYEYLSLSLATSISIGTILSFVVVGGFTQAIARRGFLYLGQNLGYMARKSTFFFIRWGFITSVIVALFFFVFNWLFSVYPWSMTAIIILYFFFLTGIWLSVTVMYILKKEMVFTVLLTVGIGLVFLFFVVFKLDIIVSQIISLSLVALAGTFLSRYYLYKTERLTERGIAPAMPRTSMMLYTTMPYFRYGFFYFLFVNLDRLVAWSTNTMFMPYIIWFRGEYELGLDFALLTLMLPMGFVEVVVNQVMMKLYTDQKNYTLTEPDAMKRHYLGFYYKWMFFLLVFIVINGCFVYYFINWLDVANITDLVIMSNRTTHFVLIFGIVAYSLLCLALMNALILFSIGQARLPNRAIANATALNAFVGFLLSRWVDYSWAVVGLLVGTVFFLVVTTIHVRKLIKDLEYYLYYGM